MEMKKYCLTCLVLLCFLSGCGKIEMNTAAIPLAVGTDYQNNEIVVSAQIAKPVSPEQSTGADSQFFVLTGTGKTLSEATRNTSLYFSSIPLWSQTQLSLTSETLAKKGIAPVVDFLVRNRYTRRNNPLVITHNASPEEILNVKPYLEAYTVMAIRRLREYRKPNWGSTPPRILLNFCKDLLIQALNLSSPW